MTHFGVEASALLVCGFGQLLPEFLGNPKQVSIGLVRQDPELWQGLRRSQGSHISLPRTSDISPVTASKSYDSRSEASVRDCAAPGLGGVPLLVRSIARSHERAGEHGAEAERLSLLPEPPELVRVHPA